MFRLRAAFFALLLAPAIARSQTDPALWRFIHPNTKALIGIDWKRVSKSPLGSMIRDKYLNTSGGVIPGAEFLDQVDRVILSSPGKSPENEAAEPQVLIVVRGHFDPAKVRRVLVEQGAKPQMFNSIQVYRPQDKNAKDMAFVVLDAQTVLIGDARSVFSALEQNAAQVPIPPNPVVARATEMDPNYEAWAVMTAPGALASDRLMELFRHDDAGTPSRGFEAGLSLRNGLAADINLMFESESVAKDLASEFSKMLKLSAKDKSGDPAMQDLEKRLKVAADGSSIKIALRMTSLELDKNAQMFLASQQRSAAALAAVRPALKTTNPPPPVKNTTIRIEGLDEGPREIPYKQP